MNNELTLNGFRYRLLRPLGDPGAIAQAFLAEALDFDGHFVVKTVSSLTMLPPEEARSQLQEEARVLAILNRAEVPDWAALPTAKARAARAAATVQRRHIVANIDAGEDPSGEVYLVQERAPEGVTPTPVQDLQDEIRILTLAERLARAMQLVHEQDIALQDFEPPSKIDRIRVAWQEARIANFKLIDWNISGDATDIPNDLVFLNSALLGLLTAQFLPLEKQQDRYHFPIVDLPTFVGEPWQRLSGPTQLLLQRLTTPLAAERPASAFLVAEELQWLIELLQRQQSLSPRQWVERVRAARGQPHHVLAIVQLLDPQTLPPRPREELEYAAWNARQALETGQQGLVRNIELDLRDGVFSQALTRLEELRRKLDPSGEAMRQANYRYQQARLGDWLRDQDINPRQDSGYQAVVTAVDAMIEQQWETAHDALERALALQEHPPVQRLKAVVAWRLQHASLQAEIERERPTVPRPDQTFAEQRRLEQMRLDQLERILHTLNRWRRDAPFETALNTQALALQRDIETRRWLLDQLQQARRKLDAGGVEAALSLGQQLAQAAPQDPRIRHLITEAESTRHAKQKAAEIAAWLDSGAYEKAQAALQTLVSRQEEAPYGKQILERIKISQLEERLGYKLDLVRRTGEQIAGIKQDLDARKYTTIQDLPEKVPVASVAISPLEDRLAADIELLQTRVDNLRADIQDAGLVMPEDQQKTLTHIETYLGRLREGLIDRFWNRLDYALEHFDRETAPAVRTLLAWLEDLHPNNAQQARLAQLEKRREELHTLLQNTDAQLQRGDVEQAVQAFEDVVHSQDVAKTVQAGVKIWTSGWRLFQNAWDTPTTVNQETPVRAPAWPGLRTLRTLILKAMTDKYLQAADAAYQAQQWDRAEDLYKRVRAYAYPKALSPEQQTHLKERLEEAAAQSAHYQQVLQDMQAKLADDFDFWRRAWTLDNLRERLTRVWEQKLWATLPQDPQPDALRRLARQFTAAYQITKHAPWQAYGERCVQLAKLADQREEWAQAEYWASSQPEHDRQRFSTFQEPGMPALLRTLAAAWERQWYDQADSCWQRALKDIQDALATEEGEQARASITQANNMVDVEGLISPPDREQLRMLQTRVQALEQRDKVIQEVLEAFTPPAEALPEEEATAHIHRLKAALEEAALYDFASTDLLHALPAYLEQAVAKQAALALPQREDTFALRIASLSDALSQNRPPWPYPTNAERETRWTAALQTWRDKLEQLDEELARRFKQTRLALSTDTQEAVRALAQQCRARAPDRDLVERTTCLLWQLAWLCQQQEDTLERADLGKHVQALVTALHAGQAACFQATTSLSTYQSAKKRLHALQAAAGTLGACPPALELPGVEKEAWTREALKPLTTPETAWGRLLNAWSRLDPESAFDKNPGAAVEAVERWMAAVGDIQAALPQPTEHLNAWCAALAAAHGALVALERVRYFTEAQNPEQALQYLNQLATMENRLPQPLTWLLGDRRTWLLAQAQEARNTLQAEIRARTSTYLRDDDPGMKQYIQQEILAASLTETAQKDQEQDALPPTAAQKMVTQAVLAAAHEVEEEKMAKDRAAVLTMWEVLAQSNATHFPELVETANAKLKELKRARAFRILGLSISTLVIIGAFIFALNGLSRCWPTPTPTDPPPFSLTQSPNFTPTPTSTPTPTPTSTPTPTPTPTPANTPTITPFPTPTVGAQVTGMDWIYKTSQIEEGNNTKVHVFPEENVVILCIDNDNQAARIMYEDATTTTVGWMRLTNLESVEEEAFPDWLSEVDECAPPPTPMPELIPPPPLPINRPLHLR